jgi:hypothetical protein
VIAAQETPVSPRTHHLPAALVAVLATALLVAAPRLLDDRGRFGAVLLLQLALVGGWVLGVGGGRTAGVSPAGTGTAVIGVAAAVGADLALELPHRPALGGLLAVLGPALLALVLDQMLRRSRRDMVAGLAGGVLLVCAVTSLAVLLLLARSGAAAEVGVSAVLAVGAALVVGHVVDLVLPRPQLAPDVPRGLTGLLLGVVAAVVVSYVRRGAGDLVDGLSTAIFGAVLGAVAALVALAGSYLAAEAGPAAGRRAAALPVVQALLPFAACAPIALALQTAL